MKDEQQSIYIICTARARYAKPFFVDDIHEDELLAAMDDDDKFSEHWPRSSGVHEATTYW